MKYIIFEVKDSDLNKKIPIIFPELLVHSEIADSIKHQLAIKHNWLDVEIISAGFLNLIGADLRCSGKSETLNISSLKEEDDMIISTYNYTHGI